LTAIKGGDKGTLEKVLTGSGSNPDLLAGMGFESVERPARNVEMPQSAEYVLSTNRGSTPKFQQKS
jgi:hypothetical protein